MVVREEPLLVERELTQVARSHRSLGVDHRVDLERDERLDADAWPPEVTA